jgi:hypothetical protein
MNINLLEVYTRESQITLFAQIRSNFPREGASSGPLKFPRISSDFPPITLKSAQIRSSVPLATLKLAQISSSRLLKKSPRIFLEISSSPPSNSL